MHLIHPTGLPKLSFGSNWVQKTKASINDISRMHFLNMDFCFTYIANFNFAHFEIEKSFGLILGKTTKWLISLAISFWMFRGCMLDSGMGFIFAHLVHKESKNLKFGKKLQNDPYLNP